VSPTEQCCFIECFLTASYSKNIMVLLYIEKYNVKQCWVLITRNLD